MIKELPVELTNMSSEELIKQRNEIESAINEGLILDPIQTAQAMSRVREIDQELFKRNNWMSIENFSTTTLEYWVSSNKKSKEQIAVIEEELRRRKKK